MLSSTTDDVIVVFHSLLEEERRLMFAGTFWEQFEPGKLVCCETSGRLFHPLDKYSSAFGRFGLVGGGVASDHLAERLVYDGDQVLLEWNKERHVVRKLSSLSS